MKNPETSILMPTYNCAQYLLECIGSILRQEYQDYEVIIIDDHSTDHTESLVKKIELIDSRVKYFKNQKNQKGIVSALNYGLKLCKGEYIARMDADDMMIGNRLKEQISYLKVHSNIHAVCSAMQLIDEDGLPMRQSLGTSSIEKSKLFHLFLNMYVHATMTAKKDVFINFKYKKNFLYAEDYELWSRVIRKFNIRHLQEIHHVYRIIKKQNRNIEVRDNGTLAILSIFSNQLDFYKIPHNERELMIHYSLYYLKEAIGSKEEITKWLNKIFTAKKIVDLFDLQTISEVRDHLNNKFDLK